jgi:hypothetical protein
VNAEEIAASLKVHMERLGLTMAEVADKAQCRVLEVNSVLAADPTAKMQTLVAVAKALGCVVFALPQPLARGIGDSLEATEPKVETRVSRALKELRERTQKLAASKVVMFTDLDGAVHAAGDSRIDDTGQLVGDQLFRWWGHLKSILDDFPEVEVVIHSSWRKFWPTVDSIRSMLPAEFAARVVDVTNPDVLRRQDSINEYLLDHPEVTAWVILDDQPGEFDWECPNLIVCRPESGLSDEGVQRALRAALGAACGRLAV